MERQKIKHVVMAGGGTAGWIAAAVANLLGKTVKVSLVESEEIGTLGEGEATIPALPARN